MDVVENQLIDAVSEQTGIVPEDAEWFPRERSLALFFTRDGIDGFVDVTIGSYGGTAEEAADADVA